MGDLCVILTTILVDIVTSVPTTGVTYTLYRVERTWNMARATCEAHGQVMLKLDTAEKLHNFNVYRDIWKNNGHLEYDIWTGLHQGDLSSLSVSTMAWYDCDPLGEYCDWDNGEPNYLDKELCVRLTWNEGKFRNHKCERIYQVACQYDTGTCEFEEFKNMTVVGLNLHSRPSTLEECQQACLKLSTDSGECVVFTISGNDCYLYNGSSVFVYGKPDMMEQVGTSVHVKRCVHGVYELYASEVENNNATEPITDCPQSTMMSSSGLSVSSYVSLQSTIMSSTSVSTEWEPSFSLSDISSSSADSSLMSVGISLTLSELSQLLTLSDMSTSSLENSLLFGSISLETLASSDLASSSEDPILSSEETALQIKYASSSSPVSTDMPEPNIYGSKSVLASTTGISSVMTGAWPSTILMDSINIIPTATLASQHDQIHTSLLNNTQVVTPSSGKDPELLTVCGCVCKNKNEVFYILHNSLKNFVNKRNLSSYRRSKNSAEDDRLSAKVIGTSGITVIVLVILLIVCMDVHKVLRACERKKRF